MEVSPSYVYGYLWILCDLHTCLLPGVQLLRGVCASPGYCVIELKDFWLPTVASKVSPGNSPSLMSYVSSRIGHKERCLEFPGVFLVFVLLTQICRWSRLVNRQSKGWLWTTLIIDWLLMEPAKVTVYDNCFFLGGGVVFGESNWRNALETFCVPRRMLCVSLHTASKAVIME